jgi:hypothetical protein
MDLELGCLRLGRTKLGPYVKAATNHPIRRAPALSSSKGSACSGQALHFSPLTANACVALAFFANSEMMNGRAAKV